MSYADVNGVSLYYEEHGSGQPLVAAAAVGEPGAADLPVVAAGVDELGRGGVSW
jgi:hypothetical protein